MHCKRAFFPLKTNMSPEKWWLEDDVPQLRVVSKWPCWFPSMEVTWKAVSKTRSLWITWEICVFLSQPFGKYEIHSKKNSPNTQFLVYLPTFTMKNHQNVGNIYHTLSVQVHPPAPNHVTAHIITPQAQTSQEWVYLSLNCFVFLSKDHIFGMVQTYQTPT